MEQPIDDESTALRMSLVPFMSEELSTLDGSRTWIAWKWTDFSADGVTCCLRERRRSFYGSWDWFYVDSNHTFVVVVNVWPTSGPNLETIPFLLLNILERVFQYRVGFLIFSMTLLWAVVRISWKNSVISYFCFSYIFRATGDVSLGVFSRSQADSRRGTWLVCCVTPMNIFLVGPSSLLIILYAFLLLQTTTYHFHFNENIF